MTAVSLAARNYLAQKVNVTSLLGSSDLWSTWIFDSKPEELVEQTGKALVVLSVTDGWAGANDHNTASFPRLTVDIWVDPTRNVDGSVKQKDAEIKAEKIYKMIDTYLHMVHPSTPAGLSIYWGTATEIANRTGVRVISSKREAEPIYRPAFDAEGACVATVRYNLTV